MRNSELPTRQVSRDEMNLAEFPLTVLSTRVNPKIKTLEFKDVVRGRNGETINRNWIVTGADKFGLPTASDDEVLLGLLKLTVADNFKARRVNFTRYELLKTLRWTTEGRSYSRLQNALDRLSGVRIKATNAFFDNETKSHSTRNFGIIDGYEINDGRDGTSKPSFFVWSDVLFKSFQVGFIKKLDLEFYLGLKSNVSRRLYRYLDKHFWYKSRVQINLYILAHEKVGISRNYRFVSSIRQQLDPAIEELIAAGMVERCDYIGRGSDTEILIYAASKRPRSIEDTRATVQMPLLKTPNAKDPNLERLIAMLVARGIVQGQAEKLLSEHEPHQLERIEKIITHYDHLRQVDSNLISRNPAGFLYRAVERFENFMLPGESVPGQGTKAEPMERSKRQAFSYDANSKEDQATKRLEKIQNEYLTFRQAELARIKNEVEPEMITKLSAEVEASLSNLRKALSPERFQEAIVHGVDEKLARLFALSEFEEWFRQRRVAAVG